MSAERARAQVRRAPHALEAEGQPRTIQAIAERTGLRVARVRTLRSPIQGEDFHGPADGRDGRTRAERLPADTTDPVALLDRRAARRTLRTLLHGAASPLAERERRILQQRFFPEGERAPSRKALGARLGISGERVRQVERRALERLKAAMQPDL